MEIDTSTLDTLDFGADINWGEMENKLGVQQKEKKNYKDDRFWKLARNENNTGVAVIQLMVSPEGAISAAREKFEFMNSFDKVNNKKRYFNAISPVTIGLPCPVKDFRDALYQQETTEANEAAKKFWPRKKYVTNIKVIKDPLNPQNEGKIFLWEYGKQLSDKLNEWAKPNEQDIEMGEVEKKLYNPLKGDSKADQANGNYSYFIKLKQAPNAGGIPVYDGTTIERAESRYATSDEIKADIVANAHSLKEFLDPEKFDTYEEIKGRFTWMLDKYDPAPMSEQTFKSVVDSVFNKDKPQSTQTTQVEDTQTTQEVAKPEPQVTQTAQVENTASDSDIDDFFDGLDL